MPTDSAASPESFVLDYSSPERRLSRLSRLSRISQNTPILSTSRNTLTRKDTLDEELGDSFDEESRSLEFEVLALKLSLESGHYSFMTMFIQRVLNVSKDSRNIFQDPAFKPRYKPPFEILPQIYIPHDLWLMQQVCIPDVAEKITLLREANAILHYYLTILAAGELFLVDERKLASFELRAADYCLIQTSHNKLRNILIPEMSPTIIEEESSNELSASSPGPNGHNLPNLDPLVTPGTAIFNKLPSIPHSLNKPKRKNGLLGHVSVFPGFLNSDSVTQPSSSSVLSLLSPTSLSASPLRSNSAHFFSRSKIYAKIKKKRELLGLVVTASTSGTVGVGSTGPESASSDLSSIFDINPITMSERFLENQKQKYAYYVEIRLVKESIKKLLAYLTRPGILANLIKLLDFIRAFIFKFIVVDVCRMIINYGHAKVVEASI